MVTTAPLFAPLLVLVPVVFPLASSPVLLELAIGDIPVPRLNIAVVGRKRGEDTRQTLVSNEMPGSVVRPGAVSVATVWPVPGSMIEAYVYVEARRERDVGPGYDNHRRGPESRTPEWRNVYSAVYTDLRLGWQGKSR